MTINFEISTDTSSKELLAIRALINSLLGEPAQGDVLVYKNSDPMFTKEEIEHAVERVESFSESVASPAEIFKQNKYAVPTPESAIYETIEVTGKTEHVTLDAPVRDFRTTGLAVTSMPSTAYVASDVETDATGLPWDHRIHSRTRSKTVDGKWRVKRGESEESIRAVENELRGTMQNARAPLPPKPPGAGAPPPPPGATVTFPEFTKKATKLLSEKRITKSELTELLGQFNIKTLALVANVPHLIPQISAAVDALIEA